MERNVLGWSRALEEGYEPRLYGYKEADVPVGETIALLDFKIWSKWAPALSCYFTELHTGRKFQLTVFKDFRTGQYDIKGTSIDFTNCPLKTAYRIKTRINEKGRVVFEEASMKT